MYGKTLDDFPERFNEFLDEFRSVDPDRLDAAFRTARGRFKEFPTPAQVRECLPPLSAERLEAAHKRLRERIEAQPEQKMLPSALDEKAPPPREVKAMTTEEIERKMDELLRQREQLLRPKR